MAVAAMPFPISLPLLTWIVLIVVLVRASRATMSCRVGSDVDPSSSSR